MARYVLCNKGYSEWLMYVLCNKGYSEWLCMFYVIKVIVSG